MSVAPPDDDAARAADESAQDSDAADSGAQPRADFFVVGVGASAGGFEAISTLIRRLGPPPNVALVVVQHLLPGHPSMLTELLARLTRAEVVTANDGTRMEPGKIYVAPPGGALGVLGGVLHFLNSGAGAPRLPIDHFFRSLADDRGRQAIGVVLSGTGTDGTFGLKAIKHAGGITFAQDPISAKFDGMPRSARESGAADYSLAPEAIAEELLNLSEHPYLAVGGPKRSPQAPQDLSKLFLLLRSAFGNDFSSYKPSTIERRIDRRMALHKIEQLEDYVKFVQGNRDELRMLYRDALIGVTSFFRDHEPFELLRTKVLASILARKAPGSVIRAWIPACSSGEEAYSVVISLLEGLDERARDYRLQVFATDLDEEAIEKARRGFYPQNIALDVSAERLHRFFVRKDDGYQIARRVRDTIVFSAQNIVRDAPFSRLDLVSCRNLLIYLQPVLQKKVLRILHYALNPGGHLMLGTSETVGDSPELFSVLDRTNKIYTANLLTTAVLVDFRLGVHGPELPRSPASSVTPRPVTNVAVVADRKVLEMYGPPGVVINEQLDILHFRGRTGPYLEPTPGAASLNILRLARGEIHADLRRALQQAALENAPVSVACKLTESEGMTRSFRLQVVPISEPETKAKCLLVLFHETEQPEPPAQLPAGAGDNSLVNARLQELERELIVTREYLQTTIEELESANEELKSSNEELQSANEELQSTNEEVETSKEELQSANEELTTVNDELHMRMADHQQTLDDLHNLLGGVDNTVILVGMDLRLRRFTQAAERAFSLVQTDVGRSISHLNVFLGGVHVEQLCAEVIESLAPVNRELLGADQRWYSLRITPYRTLEHSITGAVVVFTDIDLRKRALQLGHEAAV